MFFLGVRCLENNSIDLYCKWLACNLNGNQENEKEFVKTSFKENFFQSSAYQKDAEVNGVLCPIVATRKDTKKCSVTVLPESTLHIGDLVWVFDEYWLCVELYYDEYGMSYGELWMCNQLFIFQNHNNVIIKKYAILDDGSYTSGNDKAIKTSDNSFDCYISLDEESESLYIDKRLAIGVIRNSKGEEILEVGKINWIDVKSKNFGKGSHLMVFGIKDDAYSPENDNIEMMICDYKDTQTNNEEIPSDNVTGVNVKINGKPELRIGTTRTYTIECVNSANDISGDLTAVMWECFPNIEGIKLTENESSCKITIKEDDNLIGTQFVLRSIARILETDYESEMMIKVV